ncbi:MAG: hypothetical protein FWH40_08430, partial [Coriobacteriia bacterium]|nr:hypothetical protein [Coriobacteriia bacterium]
MRFEFSCPGCGVRALEFEAFETAIMLAPNLALMRFECPTCKTPLLIKVRLNKAQSDYLSKVQN